MALSCKLGFARFSAELQLQDRAECGNIWKQKLGFVKYQGADWYFFSMVIYGLRSSIIDYISTKGLCNISAMGIFLHLEYKLIPMGMLLIKIILSDGLF